MIKVNIVGCGRISSRHCDILTKGDVRGAVLSAVCDINLKKAEKFGMKYSLPFYTSYQEMIEKEDPDIISICTESGNHAKHVIDIAKYKKNIIVEKPMALTLDDADKMIEACDKHGVRLFVVKQNRFNIPITQLRKEIENKRFGKLVSGTIRVRWCREQKYYDMDSWRGTWEFDGGVLSQQASHHLDMLEWMMGDIEEVYAVSKTALVKIEAEDTAAAILKFTNGALGIIEATTAARPENIEGSISILGENGIVEVGGIAMNQMKLWKFKDGDEEEENKIMSTYFENPPDVYGFGHKRYYNHVIDCLENDSSALVDGLEGRKSVELLTAIYESIETKKPVKMRFKPEKCKLGVKNG